MKNLIIILLFFCGCGRSSDYIRRISKHDIIKAPIKSGDWLEEHKEVNISPSVFQLKYSPLDTNKIDTICLYVFDRVDTSTPNDFELCKTYLEIFFQRPVFLSNTNILLPNETNSRNGYTKNFQFNAKYILNSLLMQENFKNYLATMALTKSDIYPGNNWSYVFGLANYSNRVGVTSIHRFVDENQNVQLLRLLKTASHEVSHMFGLNHCTKYECVMNGSNHLGELDRNSFRLCSDCQAKLNYRLNLNPEIRLEKLITFLEKNQLEKEAQILSKDL